MSKTEMTFLGIALACLIASFAWHTHPVVNGLGKALFGVFLILFFIERFLGREKA